MSYLLAVWDNADFTAFNYTFPPDKAGLESNQDHGLFMAAAQARLDIFLYLRRDLVATFSETMSSQEQHDLFLRAVQILASWVSDNLNCQANKRAKGVNGQLI